MLKASDRLLRVSEFGEEDQVPQGGKSVSTEALQDPPVSDDPGRTDTATAADGERQETLRADLGLRDAAGLGVGESLPLANRVGTSQRHAKKNLKTGAIYRIPATWGRVPSAEQQSQFLTFQPSPEDVKTNVRVLAALIFGFAT